MVDPTTVNLVMAQPLRGTDVGTWDVPVNSNTGILDQAFGGVTTLALSSANITLASSQAQNSIIRLTGTLTVGLTINLPSIYKFWTIDNQITNSPSSFWVTLTSTGGGSILGCPPGTQDVFYDGTTINYRNLGKIGEYWDYAGLVVPNWVNNSSKPPYLNCNGTTFSSATYPVLANLLGTTTLPDSRGSARYALNQGTARLSSAVGGINGDTFLASKTTQSATLLTANLPPYTPTGTLSLNNNALPSNSNFIQSPTAGPVNIGGTGSGGTLLGSTAYAGGTFVGSAQGGTSTPIGLVATAYMGGITMIRAG